VPRSRFHKNGLFFYVQSAPNSFRCIPCDGKTRRIAKSGEGRIVGRRAMNAKGGQRWDGGEESGERGLLPHLTVGSDSLQIHHTHTHTHTHTHARTYTLVVVVDTKSVFKEAVWRCVHWNCRIAAKIANSRITTGIFIKCITTIMSSEPTAVWKAYKSRRVWKLKPKINKSTCCTLSWVFDVCYVVTLLSIQTNTTTRVVQHCNCAQVLCGIVER